MKIGKIFYSSHKSNFTDVQIKELRFESNIGATQLLASYFGKFGAMAERGLGADKQQKFKKLKAINSVENSEYRATTMIKSVLPSFLNIFAERK